MVPNHDKPFSKMAPSQGENSRWPERNSPHGSKFATIFNRSGLPSSPRSRVSDECASLLNSDRASTSSGSPKPKCRVCGGKGTALTRCASCHRYFHQACSAKANRPANEAWRCGPCINKCAQNPRQTPSDSSKSRTSPLTQPRAYQHEPTGGSTTFTDQINAALRQPTLAAQVSFALGLPPPSEGMFAHLNPGSPQNSPPPSEETDDGGLKITDGKDWQSLQRTRFSPKNLIGMALNSLSESDTITKILDWVVGNIPGFTEETLRSKLDRDIRKFSLTILRGGDDTIAYGNLARTGVPVYHIKPSMRHASSVWDHKNGCIITFSASQTQEQRTPLIEQENAPPSRRRTRLGEDPPGSDQGLPICAPGFSDQAYLAAIPLTTASDEADNLVAQPTDSSERESTNSQTKPETLIASAQPANETLAHASIASHHAGNQDTDTASSADDTGARRDSNHNAENIDQSVVNEAMDVGEYTCGNVSDQSCQTEPIRSRHDTPGTASSVLKTSVVAYLQTSTEQRASSSTDLQARQKTTITDHSLPAQTIAETSTAIQDESDKTLSNHGGDPGYRARLIEALTNRRGSAFQPRQDDPPKKRDVPIEEILERPRRKHLMRFGPNRSRLGHNTATERIEMLNEARRHDPVGRFVQAPREDSQEEDSQEYAPPAVTEYDSLADLFDIPPDLEPKIAGNQLVYADRAKVTKTGRAGRSKGLYYIGIDAKQRR